MIKLIAQSSSRRKEMETQIFKYCFVPFCDKKKILMNYINYVVSLGFSASNRWFHFLGSISETYRFLSGELLNKKK